MKILEKSTQNNGEDLAQECEKHAATNALLGQYLGSYHLRWTSKGKCEAFCRNYCRKVRLAASPLKRPTICKVTFLPTYLEPHFKIGNVKRVYCFPYRKPYLYNENEKRHLDIVTLKIISQLSNLLQILKAIKMLVTIFEYNVCRYLKNTLKHRFFMDHIFLMCEWQTVEWLDGSIKKKRFLLLLKLWSYKVLMK